MLCRTGQEKNMGRQKSVDMDLNDAGSLVGLKMQPYWLNSQTSTVHLCIVTGGHAQWPVK